MSLLMKSRTITIPINVPPGKIYRFVSNPENLPKWAKSFAKSVRCENYTWVVETASGLVTIRFMMNNTFGILDHVVMLPSGDKIVNFMRVIPNGKGSEVLFTLFKTDTLSDEQFDRDVKSVEIDLQYLKQLLEKNRIIATAL